jgi:hypothetical protein
VGVARTLSCHSILLLATHTLASVEPASIPEGQPAQLRIVSISRIITLPLSKERWGVTTSAWYREPNESSPHPGVSPLYTASAIVAASGLDPADKAGPGTKNQTAL